jgi:retron-type reverse transcriptase
MKGISRIQTIEKLNQKNKNYKNGDLYRLLCAKDLHIAAYEKLKANKGALNAAVTPDTIQGYSITRIDQCINKLRNCQWHPRLARLVMIPKPNSDKKRPLGIQGPEEKAVQEILRNILEAIYEPTFNPQSFGFRRGRGCHDALQYIDKQFTGIGYVLEGDIQACFPSIDHTILIEILKERITDQRVLDLIIKMLKAGYLSEETQKIIQPLVGTPQGSIVSPILSNIYLDKMDQWIEEWRSNNIRTEDYDINTLEYNKAEYPEKKATTTYYNVKNAIPRPSRPIIRRLYKDFRVKNIYKLSLVPYVAKWKKERLLYVRYADDFIVAFSKNVPRYRVEKFKAELTQFLKNELALTLSPEKSTITDIRLTSALFLGHTINIDTSSKITIIRPNSSRPKGMLTPRKLFRKRTTGSYVDIGIPKERILKKLELQGFCQCNGYPVSNKKLTPYEDKVIVSTFDARLRGLLNYYSGTGDTNTKYRIHYIMRFSCAKTLAHKHKTTIRKIFKKYGSYLTVKSIRRNPKNKKTSTTSVSIIRKPDIERKWQTGKEHKDPEKIILASLQRSRLYSWCSICGTWKNIEMHHINSIKRVRPNTYDSLLGFLNRKQIPLCAYHHREVTLGNYDGISLRYLLALHMGARLKSSDIENLPERD